MILKGCIVYGKQLGRTLGFPTANLAPDVMPDVMPENGVYAGWFYLEDENRKLPCVLNQGRHPTVPEGAPTIEAHVLDFSGDLYGKCVTVEFHRFLRAEIRFSSVEELREQIEKDRDRARRIWKEQK